LSAATKVACLFMPSRAIALIAIFRTSQTPTKYFQLKLFSNKKNIYIYIYIYILVQNKRILDKTLMEGSNFLNDENSGSILFLET
jgi:hypothetical protein